MEKMEVRNYFALAKIPVSYMYPDDANGTAEGAGLQREGLIFRVEDRETIAGARWAKVMSLIFETMGDATRADVSKIETIWAPIERLSLAERYSAASQASNILPQRTIWREVLKLSPREMQQAEDDQAADDLRKEAEAQAFLRRQQALEREAVRTQSQRADQIGSASNGQPPRALPPGQQAAGRQ
jgi:hypothetical protein